jgi:hypothetical protein
MISQLNDRISSSTHQIWSSGLQHADFDGKEITKGLSSEQRLKLVNAYAKNDFGFAAEKLLYDALQDGAAFATLCQEGYEKNFYESVSLIALKLYCAGKIKGAQLATCCMAYAAVRQLVEEHTLVAQFVDDNGKKFHRHIVHASGEMGNELFQIHYLDSDRDEAALLLRQFFNFSKDDYVDFLHLLGFKPASERCFHSFRLPLGDVFTWSPLYHQMCRRLDCWKPITQDSTIYYGLKPQIFVLPSFSMFEAALQVRYGAHAVALRFALGTPSSESWNEKVIHLSLPGVDLPCQVNDEYGGQMIVTLYDLCRAWRYSGIYNDDKKAIERIMQVVTEALKKRASAELSKVLCGLVDGELHDSVLKKQPFGTLFQAAIWTKATKQLVIQEMVDNASYWESTYGIGRRDLLDDEKKLYDALILPPGKPHEGPPEDRDDINGDVPPRRISAISTRATTQFPTSPKQTRVEMSSMPPAPQRKRPAQEAPPRNDNFSEAPYTEIPYFIYHTLGCVGTLAFIYFFLKSRNQHSTG